MCQIHSTASRSAKQTRNSNLSKWKRIGFILSAPRRLCRVAHVNRHTATVSTPLSAGFVRDRIAEPDARPSPVLIDEFDAGGLKSSPYDIERGSTWLVRATLELAHGDNADRGLVSEVLLTPIEKAPGGSALIRRDHPGQHARSNLFIQLRRKAIDRLLKVVYSHMRCY